jgi:hypothetical protein
MSLVTSSPTNIFVAADVNRLIILRAVFGWSGLTSAATQLISGWPVGTNAVPKSFCGGRLGHLAFEFSITDGLARWPVMPGLREASWSAPVKLVGQQHLILNFKQHLQGFRPWVSALGRVKVQPVIHLTPVRSCAAHYQTPQHFGFLTALLGAQLYQRSKRAGFWLGEFHNELNFLPTAGVVNRIIYYFNASAALPHFMPDAQISGVTFSKHPAVSLRRLWDFCRSYS